MPLDLAALIEQLPACPHCKSVAVEIALRMEKDGRVVGANFRCSNWHYWTEAAS